MGMELFSYIMMGGRLSNIELIPVLSEEGSEVGELGRLRQSFECFDAAACACFNDADKRKMLTVVETAFGDLTAFNEHVSHILRQLQREGQLWSERIASSPFRSNTASSSNSSSTYPV